jgi:hypothetical protein
VPVKSDSSDYKDRVYMASVDEINRDPHGQKISIILGSNERHLSVNSINYVQVRLTPIRPAIASERSTRR